VTAGHFVEGIEKNGEYGSGKHRWGHPETDWTSYDGGLALFSTGKFDWKSMTNMFTDIHSIHLVGRPTGSFSRKFKSQTVSPLMCMSRICILNPLGLKIVTGIVDMKN
jgi:hypothetical protein